MRAWSAVVLACLLFALPVPSVAAEVPPSPSGLVPDRVVLEAFPGGAGDLAVRARAAGLEVLDVLEAVDVVVVRTDDPRGVVASARAWPEVRGAAQDEYDDLTFRAVHRDPVAQWSLDVVGLREAWHRAAGAMTPTIAILDTGVDVDHPDLAAALWVDPATGLKGRDMVTPGASPDDDIATCNGHGTHVAGIAGAIRDNGIGVAGAAPARIMNLQVFRETEEGLCRAPRSATLAAIVFAADNGAHVVSMSLGSVEASPVGSISSVDHAWGRGVMVVASAGNDACSGCYHWPSDAPNVVSVANLQAPHALAASSNRGPNVDIAAPGTNILSTCVGGGYCTKSGTSMAAPLVAGVLALERAYRPSMSNANIVTRMELTAIDLGPIGRDDGFGHGKIDADSLLTALPTGTIYYHRISWADQMALAVPDDVHDWVRWTRTVVPGREAVSLDLTWVGSGLTGHQIEVRITRTDGEEVAAWMEDDGLLRASFRLAPGDYYVYLYGRYATRNDYWFEMRDYPGNAGTVLSVPHKRMLAGTVATFADPSPTTQAGDGLGGLALQEFDAVPDDPSLSYERNVVVLPAATDLVATFQVMDRVGGATGAVRHQYDVEVRAPGGAVLVRVALADQEVRSFTFRSTTAGAYEVRVLYKTGLDGVLQAEVRTA